MCFSSLACFLPKCLSVSVSLNMFGCFFGCYPAPVIIFAECVYCYCHTKSKLTITVIFIDHHWGRIQDNEFERHCLPLPVRCLVESFKAQPFNYIILFFMLCKR